MGSMADHAQRDALVLTANWPNADNGPYRVELTFVELYGRPQCVGFAVYGSVRPATNGDEIRDEKVCDLNPVGPVEIQAQDLRMLPLGEIRQSLVDRFGPDLLALAPEPATPPADWLLGRTRPDGWPADHLLTVAAYYTERIQSGSLRPTSDVAEYWEVSKSAAAKWVERCRKAGLLGPGQQGKVGL